MYLWNTKALASQLRSGTLTQDERFKYFFVYLILTIISFEAIPYLETVQPSIPSLMKSLLSIVVVVVGTYWSYLANKTGDDKEFIDRYVCLGLPIVIKLYVVWIAFGIAWYLIYYFAFGNEYQELSLWMNVVWSMGYLVTFYCLLVHYIKMVAQSEVTSDR